MCEWLLKGKTQLQGLMEKKFVNEVLCHVGEEEPQTVIIFSEIDSYTALDKND